MGIMQKIRSEEKVFFQKPDVKPEQIENPEHITSDPPPCAACGSTVLWESTCRDRVWRCERCQPAPSKRMVGRRIDVGPAPNQPAAAAAGKNRAPHPGQDSGGEEPATDAALKALAACVGAVTIVIGPDDDQNQLAARLDANRASGNVTGNDWADARRRYRLTDLVEIPNGKTGDLAATGYPRYVNQRF